MKFNALIPELSVADIERSRFFYVSLLGFTLEYERPEDKFIFLSYGRAQLMLEQASPGGWNTGALDYPLGRGINLSIASEDVEGLYRRLKAASTPMFRQLKTNAYVCGGQTETQREFLLQDPDGYLLRFTD